MHDFHLIDNDAETFAAGLARRGQDVLGAVQSARDTHRQLQQVRTELQGLQEKRNTASTRIGEIKREQGDVIALPEGQESEEQVLRREVAAMKPEIDRLTRMEDQLYKARDAIVGNLPNMPHPDTPDGKGDADNVEVRRGEVPIRPQAEPRDHVDLMGDGYNSAVAGWITGSRFSVLTGIPAALERGLGQFMIAMALKNGYREASVPFLVGRNALFGTGQLPKFEDDVYKTDDYTYLIPTGEVPLTNLVREQTQEADALPLRYTALTPCFRKEAGAAGRDTTGLIRQHQFMKCELVTLCTPEQADEEFEKMLKAAESVLIALDLPYRVVRICAGDLGFSAQRTYDLEVWMPSQNRFVEISSVSHCGEFQTRRMKGRYRRGPGDLGYLHSLNGSALAVGRTLAALLENHQGGDGNIYIPRVLIPFVQPRIEF
jgi:seryl-tRNA synthetase